MFVHNDTIESKSNRERQQKRKTRHGRTHRTNKDCNSRSPSGSQKPILTQSTQKRTETTQHQRPRPSKIYVIHSMKTTLIPQGNNEYIRKEQSSLRPSASDRRQTNHSIRRQQQLSINYQKATTLIQ